ncbi:MAG: PEP-utilizing enzyme [bacterium]|nr:PEP-utilizing enzyme [bacterium]
MNRVEKIKKLYSKMSWYKQGAAVRPFYIGYPWESCVAGFTVEGKQVNFNYMPFGVYLKNGFFDVYFPRENMERVADFYYSHEKRNPGFAVALKKRWQKIEVANLRQIIREIEHTDLGALSNKRLIALFKRFTSVYVSFWKEAIFLDAFDVMSDIILEKALKKEKKQVKEDDINLLISSEKFSWLQKEKEELLKLAKQIKNQANLIEKLKTHAAAYHWIYNDYAVIRNLDWKFFLAEIKKLRKSKKLYQEEKHALDLVKNIAQRRRKLIKKLKLSPYFVMTVNFLVTLAGWRDWRKACNQMANGALLKFTQEFNRRTGFSKDEIEYLWWWEVPRIFQMKKQDLKQALARRQGLFSIGDLKRRDRVFLGKEARELAQFMQRLLAGEKNLSGRPAFHGLVRGRVKIIRTQNDFYKMKKGDILVAPNTRPEYVPIMKIAAAIISVEGGLTCHSAIISRELKIPAIVGVQGAIAALKDGDLVEVDANKGIVKRL